MKLAFVLAAWAVAAISGSIYLWGLAAHFRACRDLLRGAADEVRSWLHRGPPSNLLDTGWYDGGVASVRAMLCIVVLLAFLFSLAWATL